jgi:glycosyltransferase involved in cell wall biosynthesis
MFMKLSLIICTYNWKEALDLVFKSIAQQTVMPDEILVADDGSKPDTGKVVFDWAQRLSVPVHHLWQEDRGFRVARARNLAIARASGDYVVLIDGDMVLDVHFIEDHRRAAQHGYFMQGVRLLTGPNAAKRLLDQGPSKLNLLSSDIKRRRHTIRNGFLNWLVMLRTHTNQKAVRSCNQAYWRDDLIKVNGFNESMIGYSREDNELAERMYNAGVARKNLKFAALAIHLYHPSRRRTGENPNDAIYQATINNKSKWCDLGLDQHIKEPNIQAFTADHRQ